MTTSYNGYTFTTTVPSHLKFHTHISLNGITLHTTTTSAVAENTIKSAKRWVDLQLLKQEA